MNRVPITPAGYKKLQAELQRLKTQERPKVVADISAAAAQGDLSENSEYDDAKERLAVLNRRITELESKIAMAQVIDPTQVATESVAFGATVHLKDLDTDEDIVYQIVGVDEVDVRNGRISIKTPVARALLGKDEGDTAKVRVPRGIRELEIVRIEYK